MSFRTRVLIIPKKGIILKPRIIPNYTDYPLAGMDDAYDQDDCFKPIDDGHDDLDIRIGSNNALRFDITDLALGPDQTILGEGAGGAPSDGLIRIQTSGAFDSVAAAGYNGLQKIYFPGLENNDKLGGFIEFYFHNTYWTYAYVTGAQSELDIAENSSAYLKDGIGDNSKLVVRWDGQSGPAGAAVPDVTEDIERILYI